MSRGQQGIGISAAGMYGVLTTGKPVKIISQDRRQESRPTTTKSRSTPRRTSRRSSTATAKASTFRPAKKGDEVHREARHRMGRSAARHARDDRAGRPSSSAAAAASTSIWSKRRSPIRTSRCTTSIPTATSATTSARPTSCRRSRRKSSRIRTASSWAGWSTMLKDTHGGDDVAVSDDIVLARQLRRGPEDLRRRRRSARGPVRKRIGRQEADALYQAIQNTQDRAAGDRLHLADRRGADSQGPAPGGARRVLLRGDAAAGRVSRQSVLRSKSAWPTAAQSATQQVSLEGLLRELLERKRRPHAAAVPDQHVQRPGQRRGRPHPEGSRAGHAAVARQAEAEGDRASCTRR